MDRHEPHIMKTLSETTEQEKWWWNTNVQMTIDEKNWYKTRRKEEFKCHKIAESPKKVASNSNLPQFVYPARNKEGEKENL